MGAHSVRLPASCLSIHAAKSGSHEANQESTPSDADLALASWAEMNAILKKCIGVQRYPLFFHPVLLMSLHTQPELKQLRCQLPNILWFDHEGHKGSTPQAIVIVAATIVGWDGWTFCMNTGPYVPCPPRVARPIMPHVKISSGEFGMNSFTDGIGRVCRKMSSCNSLTTIRADIIRNKSRNRPVG
jgi:hypothetical protein